MTSFLYRLKDYNTKDTIAAIATYPAKSALGVIKISGRKSLSIISKIFVPKRKKRMEKVGTYTLHYGWIVEKDKKKKIIVDEVLVSIMRAPYTYTREDVVEISSHGGILVLNKILQLILDKGARLAQPGEFTYRALVNGRIDLFQAESILSIVEAKTEEGLISAARQLRGELSLQLSALKERILHIISCVEAVLEFPEEDIDYDRKKLRKDMISLKQTFEKMLDASRYGELLKEGIKCVICGKANTGKSTLFNRLLREERVLVSKVKGTTRDVIEEMINIKGLPLRIYDTAGILEPKDLLDKMAMKLSYQRIKEAHLILFVVDYSRSLSRDDFLLWDNIKDKNVIIVVNKVDLKKKLNTEKLSSFRKPIVYISALKDKNLTKLEELIFDTVHKKGLAPQDEPLYLFQWQQDALGGILQHLSKAIDYLDKGYTIDFVYFAFCEVLKEFKKLTGELTTEEILHNIFSQFCIGK